MVGRIPGLYRGFRDGRGGSGLRVAGRLRAAARDGGDLRRVLRSERRRIRQHDPGDRAPRP